MYLSPNVAPPTCTPPPSPRSYPQRHRGAARRSLCHSFRSRSLHSSTFLLFPSFFFLSRSFKHFSPTLIRNNDAYHPRTSLHAAFTFPCALTHVYFSPLSSSSFSSPFRAPALFLHCAHTPVANAYQRCGIQTASNRRIASHRVGSSRSHRLLH